jgi:uncharacterized membrane protein
VALTAIFFYDVVKFAHVAAVVLAFGPTFGYALFQTVAERTSPRSIPAVVRGMQAIDRFMVIPGMIVILGAGLYLTIDRFDFGFLFVTVGMVAILFLLVMAFTFFHSVENKLIETSERDIAASGSGEVELSEEYWAASKRSAIGGSLAGVIVLVTIFFMVVRP